MAKKQNYTFTLGGWQLTEKKAAKIEAALEKLAEKYDLGLSAIAESDLY
tara:strand:- start:1516 stop:1662 length:147 start_codon:yes stop_codon:yes gene_type:complete